MSMETNGENQGALFAPTPVWERNRKRPGRPSASAQPPLAAEPRAFAETPDRPPMTDTRRITETPPMTEPALDRPWERPLDRTVGAAAVPEETPGLVAPIGRRTPTRRRSSLPVAVAAVSVAALGAVGVAGWYASQQDRGVAELTPGGPATEEDLTLAQATPTPTVPATPPLPPSASAATTAARPAGASRARPAAAASAAESGINASGTAALPAGLQPYSALNPSADTATGAPIGAAPLTATPAPAPIPETPPIAPEATPAPTPSPSPAASPEAVTPPLL